MLNIWDDLLVDWHPIQVLKHDEAAHRGDVQVEVLVHRVSTNVDAWGLSGGAGSDTTDTNWAVAHWVGHDVVTSKRVLESGASTLHSNCHFMILKK